MLERIRMQMRMGIRARTRTGARGGPQVVAQGRPRRSAGVRVLWGGAEVAVTCGVILLLLVVHQLWWTNRQARAGAERQVHSLERQWDQDKGGDQGGDGDEGGDGDGVKEEGEGGSRGDASSDAGSGGGGGGGSAGARGRAGARPAYDQAYAVLSIPRLGLRVPVAQGVSKPNVLNHGYVGHYPGTAQPGGVGNFALAGHRNTHGEPFRYINRLRRGDTVSVRTRDATYTYVVDRTLGRTSARDGGVIAPVPRSRVVPSAGYASAGYYITLTTCTPEFTSRYRLVVWGKLSRMTPR
ncbi:class E sortase [Streptomyces sp. NPDC088785]|uniref:class E sortase n=1 Tax=Streptomyces sp. NPDC088785 TaxID=3365897 RepID=UPI003814110A